MLFDIQCNKNGKPYTLTISYYTGIDGDGTESSVKEWVKRVAKNMNVIPLMYSLVKKG